jgi:hypothetical protein
MELIRAAVAAPLFIHIVRNPTDVVRSLIEASSGWAEPWAPSSVESACSMWIKNVEAALTSAHPDDTVMVHYESLRRDRTDWDRILKFLGIDPEWELPDLTVAPAEIAQTYQYRGTTKTYGSVDMSTTSSDHSFHHRDPANQRTLSAFERRYVEWACRDLRTTLGYGPSRARLNRLDGLRLTVRRIRSGLRKLRQRLQR